VIPREGSAVFSCPAGAGEQLAVELSRLREQMLSYLPKDDAGLEFELLPSTAERAVSKSATNTVLDVLAAFPHGAQSYNLEQPADLVDISINLAIARLDGGKFFLESSFRFFNEVQSIPLQQSVLALAGAYDLKVTPSAGYPGWQPDFDSELLRTAIALHERLFDVTPAIKAIHAGLECGILKSKNPNTDILSFGPTIRGAHSPTERLEISTVLPFWGFLKALLAEL